MAFTADLLYLMLCRDLKKMGRAEMIKSSFHEQNSEGNKVSFVSILLEEFGYLPFDLDHKKANKDVTSICYRNRGNDSFRANRYSEAIQLYTQCIALAPLPNEISDTTGSGELALGFANRSAVLFKLGYYEATVSDIERALVYNYPTKLKYKLLERKGKCLHFKGDEIKAQQIIKESLEYSDMASSLSEEQKQSVKAGLSAQLENGVPKIGITKTLPSFDNQLPIPQKTYGQHNNIPSASDCLDITYSAKKGRGLTASRNIRTGDVIVIEKSYASVLLLECQYTHCYNCYIRCPALIPCKYCSMVMYCSKNCRTESWEMSHSIECSLLHILHLYSDEYNAHLALKTILVASDCGKNLTQLYQQVKSLKQKIRTDKEIKGVDNDGNYNSDNYATVYHLIDHADKRVIDDIFQRAVVAASILYCLKSKTDFFTRDKRNENTEELASLVGGLLLRHLLNLGCNASGVGEREGHMEGRTRVWKSGDVASAIYPTVTLMNHSCDPSVVSCSQRGDTCVVRTIRPIRKGEEILDSYGDHHAADSRDYRQAHLLRRYFFECQCEACLHNWPFFVDAPMTNPRYRCSSCGQTLMNQKLYMPTVITCKNCKKETNIKDIVKQLAISSKRFYRNVDKIILGNNNEKLIVELVSHLQLLDNNVQRPWAQYNDCQEVLKECIYMFNNFYIT